MNNEEKILAILADMQTEQKVTNERLAKLEIKVDRIDSEVSDIHREQYAMQRTLEAVKRDTGIISEQTANLTEYQTQAQQEIAELRSKMA